MIGKTTKGKGFGGVLRYVFQKPEAKYIGGNMIGETPNELAREFQVIASQSKKVKIPVAHISFSPSPQEHLDDRQALEFAIAYMDKIGFSECQWVLARHDDTKTPEGKERPHFHIIANRVRITDGRVVTAWRDWRRSEIAIRALEQEFDLVQVQPSWEHNKSAASRGQTQRVHKEWKELELLKRDKPPDLPVKVQLQNTIDQAAVDHPRLPQLIERLQDAGVEVKVAYTRTGKVKGISYKQDEITFSGTQLGKAYTFPGLAKYKGVSYDSIREDDAIKIRLSRILQSMAQVNFEQDSSQASIAQVNFEQDLKQASIAQVNLETKPILSLMGQVNPEQDLTQTYISVNDERSVDDSNSSGKVSINKSVQDNENTTLQREQERIQFIANVVADYLAQKRVQRLQGKTYTAYWDSNELTILKNCQTNNHEEILRVKYQDNLWSSVGVPQISEFHENDFQEMHSQIQQDRVKMMATVIHKLLASQDNQNENQSVDSRDLFIQRLEGKRYTLVEDKMQNHFSLRALDGRGKILLFQADGGAVGNFNLQAEDVHFFEGIAERFAQEKLVRQRKSHQNNWEHDFD